MFMSCGKYNSAIITDPTNSGIDHYWLAGGVAAFVIGALILGKSNCACPSFKNAIGWVIIASSVPCFIVEFYPWLSDKASLSSVS